MLLQGKLSSKQACEMLGVSRATLYLWRRDGYQGRRLRSFTVGRHRWFLPADLETFIQRD